MNRSVSAADRVRDAVALALLAGGAAVYWFAHSKMRAMAAGSVTPRFGQSYVAVTDGYLYLSRAGLLLALAGLAAGLWSFWSHARARSAPDPNAPTPE